VPNCFQHTKNNLVIYCKIYADIKHGVNYLKNFSHMRITPYDRANIFWPETWQQWNGSIHIWQCVQCTCRCYHQIDVNIQVSLVWGKKNKHILNQSFVVLLRHTEDNMEQTDRQHKILIPTFNNLQSSPQGYLHNSTILDKGEW
jgi:hypothetical protein